MTGEALGSRRRRPFRHRRDFGGGNRTARRNRPCRNGLHHPLAWQRGRLHQRQVSAAAGACLAAGGGRPDTEDNHHQAGRQDHRDALHRLEAIRAEGRCARRRAGRVRTSSGHASLLCARASRRQRRAADQTRGCRGAERASRCGSGARARPPIRSARTSRPAGSGRARPMAPRRRAPTSNAAMCWNRTAPTISRARCAAPGEAMLKLSFADGRVAQLSPPLGAAKISKPGAYARGESEDRGRLDDLAERLTQLLHEQGVAAGRRYLGGRSRGRALGVHRRPRLRVEPDHQRHARWRSKRSTRPAWSAVCATACSRAASKRPM